MMCNSIDEYYDKLKNIELWILIIGVVKNIDAYQFWIFDIFIYIYVSVLFFCKLINTPV